MRTDKKDNRQKGRQTEIKIDSENERQSKLH